VLYVKSVFLRKCVGTSLHKSSSYGKEVQQENDKTLTKAADEAQLAVTTVSASCNNTKMQYKE
jgi:hypothetical protein